MKIYGWVRHLYRDEPVSHEERMRLKRRDEDCAACYGIDAIDALDAFPLPPLTAPLVALALEAA